MTMKMKTKMKTEWKLLGLIALAGWVMPLSTQGALISADGQLPTFYVFADAESAPPADKPATAVNWRFEPKIENGSPVTVRVLTPELEFEQVKTPGVSMALTHKDEAPE